MVGHRFGSLGDTPELPADPRFVPLVDPISRRKADHLHLSARSDMQSRSGAGWDEIILVHNSLPEINYQDIDLGVEFLGRRFAAPIVVSAMTGGHPLALEVNARLARVAQRFGLAMGLGSQRAHVVEQSLLPTFRIARDVAPDLFLLGNIGAPQLVDQGDDPGLNQDDVAYLVEAVGANALAVHLNPLQEAIQLSGDRNASGVLDAIGRLCRLLSVPVIVKETGGGLSREVARKLSDAGVLALDVGGLGGTNMALVEAKRAEAAGDETRAGLGSLFAEWGIPTPIAVLETVPVGLPVIATGGVRSGLDIAKAIALGAQLAGVAQPLLLAALESEEAVAKVVERMLDELRTACFLTGCRRVLDLQQAPRILAGRTLAWATQRSV